MEPTPEQLAAGQSKGLTPEMCARLSGATPEELSADADAFLAEFNPPAPPAPAYLVGGPRGTDVSGHTGRTLAAGAEAYYAKYGAPDDEDKRPEPKSGRNPFAETSYIMETS
ncbi:MULTISPECIES: hypothetical protein [unclassified Streptomyces]|uniref:hypothetical protein n=1 Tax=unclassified Streptomyces TaxID=2593676 RepID=UPI00369BF407